MNKNSLEVRIAELEKELAELRVRLDKVEPKKDWRRTFGMFTGDEIMKQIDAQALKYREEDRRKTRPKTIRKKPRKASA